MNTYYGVTLYDDGTAGEIMTIQCEKFLYAPKSIHSDLEELNNLIYNPVDGMFPDKEKCTTLLIRISKALKYDKM